MPTYRSYLYPPSCCVQHARVTLRWVNIILLLAGNPLLLHSHIEFVCLKCVCSTPACLDCAGMTHSAVSNLQMTHSLSLINICESSSHSGGSWDIKYYLIIIIIINIESAVKGRERVRTLYQSEDSNLTQLTHGRKKKRK